MSAPMTAAIPLALELSAGYTMRFTAVDPATGNTASGVTVSGVTVEGDVVLPDVVPTPEPFGPIFLLPGPALVT